MRHKKLLFILKRISAKKIVAIVFLATLLVIAAFMTPSTLMSISTIINSEDKDFSTSINEINALYRYMLEFKGSFPTDKGAYINLNGFMARVIGQRYVNDRVKLYNGHLTNINVARNPVNAGIQMTKLNDHQVEKGKYFLFVITPSQLPKYENIMPAGYTDYSHANADNLLEILKNNNVPFLDLREELDKDGISYSDAFYVTDHHWKPEIGFWAYTKIVDFLVDNKMMGQIDPMYTDFNKYNIELYKDFFLGSSGKRTGSYYAGVDDFGIVVPKDDNWGKDVVLEIPSIGVLVKESFKDVIFDHRDFEDSPDYFIANPYGRYGYGDKDHKNYFNAASPLDQRILAIGDSYSISTFSYLSLVANRLDCLDMRYFKYNFAEYYYDYDPDIIIVLVNGGSGTVSDNTTYDFFGDSG